MVQHPRHALDDRQPEAEPARHLGGLVEALELLEDELLLRGRNAEAGVPDLQRDAGAAPPRAHQHAPARRVFDRIRDQVLQDAAQEPAVRAHGEGRRHDAQLDSLVPRHRLELAPHLPEQLVEGDARPLRLHGAGVEPRDVEQRGQDLLDRIERGVDVLGQDGVAALARPLDQRAGIKAGRVEGLQDVVAGGGEEARLRDVGLVGFGLGGGERRVEARQLLGALAHALLEQLVGAGARILGRHRVGDVRVGGDEAAVGQLVGADLDHPSCRLQAQALRLAVVGEAVQTLGDQLVDRTAARRSRARR